MKHFSIILCAILISGMAFGQTSTPTPTVTPTPTSTPTYTPGANCTPSLELVGASAGFQKIEFNFIADATGDATYTTTQTFTGEVVRAVFVNTTEGSSNYNVTVKDYDGADVLAAAGTSINDGSTTVTQFTGVSPTPIYSAISNSTLEFTLSGASDRHTGKAILYIRR